MLNQEEEDRLHERLLSKAQEVTVQARRASAEYTPTATIRFDGTKIADWDNRYGRWQVYYLESGRLAVIENRGGDPTYRVHDDFDEFSQMDYPEELIGWVADALDEDHGVEIE